MTRTTAKTLLKRYGFDDSDPLHDWLDEGQELTEDAHDWPWLFVAASATSSVGVQSLSVTPATLNAFKPRYVKDTTSDFPLVYWEPTRFHRDISDESETGLPTIYTVAMSPVVDGTGSYGGMSLLLYPTPDMAHVYSIGYQRRLNPVSSLATDGTQLDGDRSLHYPTVLAAAFIGLMAENEEERAQTALAQYDTAVEARWQKYSDDNLAGPGQVVDVMEYGSN